MGMKNIDMRMSMAIPNNFLFANMINPPFFFSEFDNKNDTQVNFAEVVSPPFAKF